MEIWWIFGQLFFFFLKKKIRISDCRANTITASLFCRPSEFLVWLVDAGRNQISTVWMGVVVKGKPCHNAIGISHFFVLRLQQTPLLIDLSRLPLSGFRDFQSVGRWEGRGEKKIFKKEPCLQNYAKFVKSSDFPFWGKKKYSQKLFFFGR